MNQWSIPESIALVDIKKDMYTHEDIQAMFALTGAYEHLFSKRSQNFVAKNLKETIQSDADYGKLLLQDYTFLKRPILIFDRRIFIGNDSKNAALVQQFLINL
jgi:arsenate reductase-like glutaredoxin family protein